MEGRVKVEVEENEVEVLVEVVIMVWQEGVEEVVWIGRVEDKVEVAYYSLSRVVSEIEVEVVVGRVSE